MHNGMHSITETRTRNPIHSPAYLQNKQTEKIKVGQPLELFEQVEGQEVVPGVLGRLYPILGILEVVIVTGVVGLDVSVGL